MSLWLLGKGSRDKDKGTSETRLVLRVAEAQIQEFAAKVEGGTLTAEDLKQDALLGLRNALTLATEAGQGKTTRRDKARASAALTRASNVVRQWLADEKGESGGGHVTAIQIIMSQPAAVSGDKAADNGHARAGSLEANGLRVRLK